MANMCRYRTGDWSVVIGPGLALALGLLYIFVYIFSFSSLVRVVANLRRCLHYHIMPMAISDRLTLHDVITSGQRDNQAL